MNQISQELLSLSSRKWTKYAVHAVFSLVTAVFTLIAVMQYSAGFDFFFSASIAGLALIAVLALGIKLVLENRSDESFAFLVLATPMLCGLGLLILPDHIPDEIWHIYRVFNFTGSGEGGMTAPLSIMFLQMPANYEELYFAITAQPDWDSSHIVERDMSSYLSHLYLVPGIVSSLGEALGLNPFAVVFMARLSNAILYLVGGYWILRIIPLGKTVAFVYLLNPLLLQQEASCSADAFANIITLLFVAYFLRLLLQEEKITLQQGVVLGILFVFMALSKYAYAPLAALSLLLVPKVVSEKKVRIVIYSLVFAIVAFVFVYVVFFYTGEAFKDALDLVRDPLELIAVFLRSIFFVAPFWFESFGGLNLGALSIYTWEFCLWAFFIMLVLALTYNLGEKHSLSRNQKLFIVALMIVIFAMILLALREWTLTVDNRSDIIMGLQGRYLVPILLPMLLCFIGPKSTLERPNCLIGYSIGMATIFCIDLALIVRFFL